MPCLIVFSDERRSARRTAPRRRSALHRLGILACAVALGGACSEEGSLARARVAITNGTPDEGDPAVVALVSNGFALCTGTLISPRIVLTAAHCQISATSYLQYQVYFGSALTPQSQTVALVDAKTHPQFDSNTLANDIAVAFLAEASTVAPAPLLPQFDPSYVNATVRLAGFGDSAAGAGDAGQKRQGTALVSDSTATTFSFTPAPSQPCAHDSGGPAFLTVGGVEYLAGVTSHGDAACMLHGTDTRVDAFVQTFVDPYIAETAPATKTIGQHCLYPEQCTSTLCVGAADEPKITYCSQPCRRSADCPPSMACTTFAGASLCRYPLPTPGALSSMCHADTDCVNGECISGNICSRRCLSKADCPSGFDCELAGGAFLYCVAVAPKGGCAFASPPRHPPPASLVYLLGAFALFRLRRRSQ